MWVYTRSSVPFFRPQNLAGRAATALTEGPYCQGAGNWEGDLLSGSKNSHIGDVSPADFEAGAQRVA
jgi:hypothetical protein